MSGGIFPVISVDGEIIPRAAIVAEAQHHPAARNRPGDAWRGAARALVVRKLLLRRAHALGLTPTPRDLGDGRREAGEEALIRQVMEADVRTAAPSEADVQAFYAANRERFRGRRLYEASHILFATEPDDAAAAARAEARVAAALLTLRDRPEAFAAIAETESDCPSRANGGRLGQFMAGDMAPEFEAALDDLEPGAIGETALQSRFGWHVVRLDARAEGHIPPLDAIAPAVREAVEKLRWTQAAHAFVRRLVAEAQVEGVSMQDAA